jgi:hypothetical protein
MRIAPLLFAVGALGLAGCQDPDVGGLCDIPGVPDGGIAADYVLLGETGCDNLVCIESPVPATGSVVKNNPYCSKPCVADNDCFTSDTGLICRPVVLDETFLNSLPPDVRAKYLPNIQNSKYCAAPVPPP